MDEEKIEPFKFKTPWLGKQIARLFLTVGTETRALYRSSRLRLFVAFWLFRGFDGLKRYYLLLPIAFAVALFVGLWFELVADLRKVVDRAAKALLDVDLSSEAVRNTVYMLAGGFAALAALATAPFALIKAWVNERQATTAEQGLITDRITRAVEQLGAEKTVKTADGKEETKPNLEVRLGAIYALERIAQDSVRDHIPIMETLCAYVRQNAVTEPPNLPTFDAEEISEEAPLETRVAIRGKRREIWRKWRKGPDGPKPPRDDVAAVLSVFARRKDVRREWERRASPQFRIDLRRADLRGLDLTQVDLRAADLSWAKMEGVDLRSAQLEGVRLHRATIEGADLSDAKMKDAILDWVTMDGATLRFAKMERATLRFAQMEGVDLSGSRLEEAVLSEAKMAEAILRMTKMERVDLTSAEMEKANLQGANMKGAILSGAKMERTDLRHAKIERADLSGATLPRATLTGCELTGTRARTADFRGAALMTQDQVNSLFGDHDTKLPEGMQRTTLLDRAPRDHPRGPDPEYDAWLAVGAPPGTPLLDP